MPDDEIADAGGIHVWNFGEVDQNLLLAAIVEFLEDLAKLLTHRERTAHVEDQDVADAPFVALGDHDGRRYQTMPELALLLES